MLEKLKIKGRKIPLKTLFATCTALATLTPSFGHAQLSIMGALDSRPRFAPSPIPKPVVNNTLKAKQNITSSPQIYQPVYQTKPQPTGLGSASGFSAEEIGFHKDLGVITARGNVEIIHGERVLIADTISYNQNKDVVSASGNVQIIEADGNVTFAEYIEISSDLKTGVIKKLLLTLADNSSITAAGATRKDGRFTIAKDADYSPCQKCNENPDRPVAWKLNAKEVQHDSEQRRLEYSDVFFEVYDVPVFYFPYFTHPDPTRKRETGLLTPSFGSRGTLDGFVDAPVFINISPDKDMTLTPTWYYDLNQLHMAGEYRQHFTNGEINLAGTLTYADGGEGSTDTNKEEFRGHIDSDGQFNIDNTWRWGFDLNHATDDTYIRRYGVEDESDNGHLISNLYVEGFRSRSYMNTNLSTYQEHRATNSDDLQDGKLEYLYSHKSQPSSTGAYWRIDGGAHGINRKNDTRTTRLAADTSWILPYTSPTGDLITLDANLITAGYYTSDYNSTGLSSEYSGSQGRAVPTLSFEWRKPVSRTQMNGKANEIFEPIVKIKAAPNVGQNYKIPNEDSQEFEFDDSNLFKTNRYTGIDKIDGGQRVDFGFNWGIYGQDGGYSQMFIGQSYRLRDDATYAAYSGHEDKISDIVGRVKVSPSSFLDVLYRYRLDKNNMELNRSETELSVGPKSTRFSLSHLFIEGSATDSEYGTREEIYGKLTNQVTKNWYSEVDGRYRMNDPEGSVSYGGELGYQDECTKLYFDFRRNFSEDRDIKPSDTFTIRLELKNLGGVGLL